MKKQLTKFITCITVMTFALPITSLAGSWQSENDQWKYQNDEGSYLTNGWLSDNGSNYYFDSNGIMLKNTLAPDGSAIDRNGKKLPAAEALPASFPGGQEEYVAFHNLVFEFLKGYNSSFDKTYDENLVKIIRVSETKDYENARNLIAQIDGYDFLPYMSSGYPWLRNMALVSETFRIEQTYYMKELVTASEQERFHYVTELMDKISISVDKQYNHHNALIVVLGSWTDGIFD